MPCAFIVSGLFDFFRTFSGLFYYADAGKVDVASISDEEWKKRLTKEQYYIARQKGTEGAFTG